MKTVPLPEPTVGLGAHRWTYSAEQMQAYGDAREKAALEAAIEIAQRYTEGHPNGAWLRVANEIKGLMP